MDSLQSFDIVFKIDMMLNLELVTGECEGNIWEMVHSYRTVKENVALSYLNLGTGSILLICFLRKNLVISIPVRGYELTLDFQSCGEKKWWCFFMMEPKHCKNMNLGMGEASTTGQEKGKGVDKTTRGRGHATWVQTHAQVASSFFK